MNINDLFLVETHILLKMEEIRFGFGNGHDPLRPLGDILFLVSSGDRSYIPNSCGR